jgi:hypothetical protein
LSQFLEALIVGLFFIGWGIYGIKVRRIFWTGGTVETGKRAIVAGVMFIAIGLGFSIASFGLLPR